MGLLYAAFGWSRAGTLNPLPSSGAFFQLSALWIDLGAGFGLRAGKPLDMMIAIPAQIGHPFPAQEGIVGLDTCLHSPRREARKRLTVPLAVDDGGTQRIGIQRRSDGWKILDAQWGHHDFPIGAIEGELTCDVIYPIVLDSFGDQIRDDIREWQSP